MSTARTDWRRAQQYDPQFERALIDEIGTAIVQASVITDADVLALRTAETIAALTTVLAGIVAMTPGAVRSPTALRRFVEEIAKHLRVQAGQTAADPEVQFFRERVFNGNDVRGRA